MCMNAEKGKEVLGRVCVCLFTCSLHVFSIDQLRK